MGHALTTALLEVENAYGPGTNGVSEHNRSLGFRPAFFDRHFYTRYEVAAMLVACRQT
jgi:hypothetical protein